MSYLVSAYAVTVGTLVAYGIALARERKRLRAPTRNAPPG